MNKEISFGQIVKERRRALDLTQDELARRVACATITIRKIEYNARRPSQQIAERLAMALNIPLDERADFVRLARAVLHDTPEPSPLPTPPPTSDEIGQEDLSGRAIRGYELSERVGTGGFGVVYRAVQPLIKREVAVKIILPQYADHPDFIRRFEAEAQLVARLEHPYIVPLYDYWREPGVAYLVMRLLRGGSLHTALRDGPLALETVAVLLEQVGAALHAAHRVGVIHRDLKPANVLLDEDGNGYLADFGIAKNLSDPDLEDLTQVGAMVGSPAYSSPEQIRSELVKPQADIYCLGVLVYELLTGDKPFRGPTPVDYILQHLNEPLPSLDGHGALDPVIQRATAKNPLDRYPDVPSLLADFRQAVTGDSSVVLAVGEIPHRVTVTDEELENPYKGLRPFGEADAADFFGREALVQELLGRMAEADDPAAGARQDLGRFLAVVGPSGSGKSSVVKAGLIPALRQGGILGSEDWFIIDLMPGAHPMEELEAALLRIAVNPPESLLAQLREDERGLLRAVRRVLPADPNIELVLVIDQFEEVFTQVTDEAVRTHLLDSLVTAVLDERSQVRVVVTLRADFTGRALEYVDFGELVRHRTAFVLPLPLEELEQAIVGPAARSGLAVEPGLVATMMQDVGDQPGILPLLQYALTELFERREGRMLMLSAYQESDGVTGALARRAEELYSSLDKAGQEAARQIFLRLVTVGEGVSDAATLSDTRRRVLRTELAGLTDERLKGQGLATMDQVIEIYGRYRLLTFDHDPVTRMPTVEVAHEALLREWPRLRGWLESSRIDIHMQRLLAAATAEWEGAEREPSYLLRGARLAQFEGWFERSTVALTGNEHAYLETSVSEREAREVKEKARQQRELETIQKLAETDSRRVQVLKRGAMALAGALLVAIVLAVVAFFARQEARRQASIGLGSQAVLELEGSSPERAALLALEALENYPYTWQAERALSQAALGLRLRMILQHEEYVNTVQWSQDRMHILTSSKDRTAKVWDANSGEELLTLSGHQDRVQSAVWSPSEDRIVTASWDGTAKVWDAITGEELVTFARHHDWVIEAEWSPDGTRIATVSPDGPARVWDPITGEEFFSLRAIVVQIGTVRVGGLAWSPSGDRIVTAGMDGTARVWDATTGEKVSDFRHGGILEDPIWSPDGTHIATASWEDDTVKVWDAATGEELLTFSGHTLDVRSVTWSPSGETIISTDDDGNAKIWDAATGDELLDLYPKNHTSITIAGAVWSPSGDRVATRSFDGTAIVWDAITGAELFVARHAGFVHSLAWSPSGDRIVTASEDRTAKVWDVAPGPELVTLYGHTGRVLGADWSPSGDRILTTCADGTAKVWDAATGAELFTLYSAEWWATAAWSPSGEQIVTCGTTSNSGATMKVWDAATGDLRFLVPTGHVGDVNNVTWSPDGERITTSGEGDGTTKVWDASTGKFIFILGGHKLWGVHRWSPSGDRILTSGFDDRAMKTLTVKVWDSSTSELLLTLSDFSGSGSIPLWSADGTRIVTHSDSGVGKVWDATTGEELLTFEGHASDVDGMSWSPAGDRLVTGSTDGTARVWDISTGAELVRYPIGGTVNDADWSPDGTRILVSSADGTATVLPAWKTTQELIERAKECCVIRELTAEEREMFGLLVR
ncbi:MAG: protein kinase [Chloroflexi bacterium]|nr:protein kinase [Chloroflexota bacterium]